MIMQDKLPICSSFTEELNPNEAGTYFGEF